MDCILFLLYKNNNRNYKLSKWYWFLTFLPCSIFYATNNNLENDSSQVKMVFLLEKHCRIQAGRLLCIWKMYRLKLQRHSMYSEYDFLCWIRADPYNTQFLFAQGFGDGYLSVRIKILGSTFLNRCTPLRWRLAEHTPCTFCTEQIVPDLRFSILHPWIMG